MPPALKAALSVFDAVFPLIDKIAAGDQGRVVTPEDQSAYDRASEALDEALWAMGESVPTSVQGIRAMLLYLIDEKCFTHPRITAALQSVLASPVLADVAGA